MRAGEELGDRTCEWVRDICGSLTREMNVINSCVMVGVILQWKPNKTTSRLQHTFSCNPCELWGEVE